MLDGSGMRRASRGLAAGARPTDTKSIRGCGNETPTPPGNPKPMDELETEGAHFGRFARSCTYKTYRTGFCRFSRPQKCRISQDRGGARPGGVVARIWPIERRWSPNYAA